MAVDLKSFSVKRSGDTNQLEGFKSEEIKDPRKEAQERLLALRKDLRSKTGVVRLLHTTKANKGMKFKNAGAFKRMFLSGEKLKLSGEVIGVLLKEAGLSEDQVGKFKQYVEKRGNSGVKAQKVLQYIDMLRMDTGSTEEEVLSKFGVDLGQTETGRELGRGGFGVARTVKYRGEPYVYKRPKEGPKLGTLGLIDGAGKALKPAPVVYKQSLVEPYDPYKKSGESDSLDSRGSREGIIQAQEAQSWQVESNDADKGQKLARTGMGNVARVKDLPQLITPSVFVVKEWRSDGTTGFHAVAGQKTLKDWAKTQNKTSSFDVVGLLMPKAKGKEPLEYHYPKGAPLKVEVNVARSDLKPMAESALKMLEGMAKHGFIHGDIKPENLFWDAKTKELQLIDNDGLMKVSKKSGSEVPESLGVRTHHYLNPIALQKKKISHNTYVSARVGLGRDLYAMGLVLLEASVMAKASNPDQIEKAMSLVDAISMRNDPYNKIEAVKSSPEKTQDLEQTLIDQKFPADSPEAFAISCILESIKFERDRLNAEERGFDRSENGKEMALIEQLKDQLAQVR